MNVITPEAPQVTVDSDVISDESSGDFSQTLEQAQMPPEPMTAQGDSIEAPSQTNPEAPIPEDAQEPEQQTSADAIEPSDNNPSQQQPTQVSEQATENLVPENVRKALENTQHLKDKKNFDQLVEKIPHWSNSVILAHAGVTRQPPPGKAQSVQETAAGNEGNTEGLQEVTSEQEANVETAVLTNSDPDILITPEITGTANSPVASSENSQLVELVVAGSQAEQNQTQPASTQDTASQPNVADEVIPAPQTEQPQPALQQSTVQQPAVQQPAAQVGVIEQPQQVTGQPQEISVSVEPETPVQQSDQLTMENNVVNANVEQSLPQKVAQDSSTSGEQNFNPSQANTPVDSETVTQQSVSNNNNVNSQQQIKQQTQQPTDDKFAVDSLINKSSGEQTQTANIQTVNSTTQTVQADVDQASQQMVNTSLGQNLDIQPEATAQLTENAETEVILNSASAVVSKQIQESIQSSFTADRQEITINLQPPELGKVTIKFEQQGDDITGQLEVTKAETRSQIEQQLPEIIKNLADAGIQIKKIEVNLNDQFGQNEYKQQSSQEMFFSDQQYNSQQQTDSTELSQQQVVDQTYQTGLNEHPQMLEPEGSLDMLV
jgi:flagellar hook-length control protein FliK